MKKRIIYLSILALIVISCKKVDEHLPPNFNYPIPQVDITENVLVGAFYSNYATADWAKKFSNTPQLGQYSPLTASVMTQHRSWADLGGIDFFALPWNGTT